MRERSRTWVDIGRVAFRSSGMLLENAALLTEDQGPDAVGVCAYETRTLGAARL
jgi:hypothetical protein